MSNDPQPTGDKRSVTTDALATLGTVIDANQKRDAIHLAVEPVVAGEVLDPGDHITVQSGLAYRTRVGMGLGIVDPFLPTAVDKGQRFWFIMYPRQVHSLRHVWSHPAFPDEPALAAAPAAAAPEPMSANARAWKWLDEYAAQFDRTGKALVKGAIEWLDRGDYLVGGAEMEGAHLDSDFWNHFQVATGRQVPADKRENFLSCSC